MLDFQLTEEQVAVQRTIWDWVNDAKIIQIYIGANELCRQLIGEEL